MYDLYVKYIEISCMIFGIKYYCYYYYYYYYYLYRVKPQFVEINGKIPIFELGLVYELFCLKKLLQY